MTNRDKPNESDSPGTSEKSAKSPHAHKSEGNVRLGGILQSEQELIDACMQGETCIVGNERPTMSTETNTIRAEIVANIARSITNGASAGLRGIRLKGAFIDGDLDISDADTVQPLYLEKCWLSGKLVIRNSCLQELDLTGTRVAGIKGNCVKSARSIKLSDGFYSDGELAFQDIDLTGSLDCDLSTIRNSSGRALDLSRAKVSGNVNLRNGFIAEGEVRLLSAKIMGSLALDKGRFLNPSGSAIIFDRAAIVGSVFMRNGFCAEGNVRFIGANIGGSLSCNGGRFSNSDCHSSDGRALVFDRAKIAGSVYMSKGFAAKGWVRLMAAEIGGSLFCSGGYFKNSGGRSLSCDRARITDGVFLRDKFSAEGQVRLVNAEIGGDLDCSAGTFKNTLPEPGLRVYCGQSVTLDICKSALDISGAQINGSLRLSAKAQRNRDNTQPEKKHALVMGSLRLTGAHASALEDGAESWPAISVLGPEGIPLLCVINIDGFCYGRFGELAATTANDRKAWLQRQPPSELGRNFKHQPFLHLTKVFHDTGFVDEARDISVLRKWLLLRRRIGGFWWLNPLYWAYWLLFGVGTRYGYNPQRIVYFSLLLWLASALFYDQAALHGVMAPADPKVFMDSTLRNCLENWVTCDLRPMANEHTPFVSWAYALDVLLPIVPLGQQVAWAPMTKEFPFELGIIGSISVPKWGAIALMWILIGLGWAVGLVLVAIVGGAVKRD